MKIENGIYYTDEELTITNIYDVIKQGFEEALQLAVEGKVKGFAAVGFDKKYGWNGSTYYELINLDYQDLSEYNPEEDETVTIAEPEAEASTEANPDVEALREENEQLKEQLAALKPFADKYLENAELLELLDKLKERDREKLILEIERMQSKLDAVAADAQTILDRIAEK